MEKTKERFSESADALWRDLLANLEGIQGCLASLATGSGQLTGLQSEHIGSAKQYAANLQAMLEGLSECAQITRGQFVTMPREMDLRELLRLVTEPHAAPMAEHGIEIVADTEPGMRGLMADERLLRLIVSNLLCAASNLPSLQRICIFGKRSSASPVEAEISINCSLRRTCVGIEGTPSPLKDWDFGPGFFIASKIAKALNWPLSIRSQNDVVVFLLEPSGNNTG